MLVRQLVAASIFALALASRDADCSITELACKTCRRSALPVNTVAFLPRFGRSGGSVPGGLGTYAPLLRCAPDTNTSCSVEVDPATGLNLDDPSKTIEALGESSPAYTSNSRNWLNYLDSIALYGVLSLLGIMFLVLAGIIYIPYGMFCCCCHQFWKEFLERCFEESCMCCCCRPCCGKRKKRRRTAVACVTLFIVLTLGLSVAGFVFGVMPLGDAAAAIATSGDMAGSLVHETREPMSDFVTSAMSGTLTATLMAVNSTLAHEAKVPQMLLDLQSIIAATRALPATSTLLDAVSALETSMKNLPNTTTTATALASFSRTVSTANSLLPAQVLDLQKLDTALPVLQTVGNSTYTLAVASIDEKVAAMNTSALAVLSALSIERSIPKASEIRGTVTPPVEALLVEGCGSCGTDNGTSARSNVLSVLSSLRGNWSVASSAALNALSSRLVALNQSIDAFASSRELNSPALSRVVSATLSLPQLNATAARLETIDRVFSAFEASTLSSAVSDLRASLDAARPSLHLMQSAVDSISAALREIRPPVSRLASLLPVVNETVLRLPNEFGSLADTLARAANTTRDLGTQLSSAANQLSSFNSTLTTLPPLAEYELDIPRLASNLSSYSTSVNSTELAAVLSRMSDLVSQLQVDAFLTSARSAEVAFQEARPSTALLESLSRLAAATDTSNATSLSLTVAVQAWGSGVCLSDARILCTCANPSQCLASSVPGPSPDCAAVGGLCSMRYSAAVPGVCQHTANSSAPQICETNANCTSGPCLSPKPEQEAFLASIATYTVVEDTRPSLAGVSLRTTAALSRLDSIPAKSLVQGQLIALGAAAGDAPPTSPVISSSNVILATSREVADTSTLSSSWETLATAIDLSTLAGLREDLGQFNATRSDVEAPAIREAESSLSSLVDFMTTTLSHQLSRITRSALTSVFSEGGVSAQLRVVADVLAVLATNGTLGRSSVDRTALASSLASPLEPLDDTVSFASSPTLYALEAFGLNVALSANSSPTTGRIHQDGTGQAYSDGKLCLTESCISNTKDYFTEGDIRDTTGQDASFIPFSIPTLYAGLVLFVWPAILALWAIGPMACCRKCKRTSRCCGHTLTTLLCLFALPSLLLAGVVGVPIVMLAADGCASMENVLWKTAPEVWPTVCTTSLKGQIVGQTCTFNQSELTLSVDLPGVVGDVLGSCSIAQLENRVSPYSTFWDSLRENMDGLALRHMDNFLESMQGKAFEPLGSLRHNLRIGASNLTTDLQSLVDSTSNVLTCSRVNAAVLSVRDAACCDGVGVVYMLITTWVLLAWIGCFCGCCCAGFGRNLWYVGDKDDDEAPVHAVVQTLAGEDPPLVVAATSGSVERVDKLMKEGAAVNVQSPATGDTALIVAAKSGHAALLKRLLRKHGADPQVFNNDGVGPLLAAVLAKNQKCVKHLIEADAEPNPTPALVLIPESAIETNCTPMIAAVLSNQVYVVQLLLAARASVDDVGGGDPDRTLDADTTPLIAAAFVGNHGAVKTLLNAGASVNVSTARKNTALHYAARGGHIKVAALLVQRGIDVNVVNADGFTPLDLAEKERNVSVAKHIRSHGGKNAPGRAAAGAGGQTIGGPPTRVGK